MARVRRPNPVSDCPLTAALAAMGGKWKLIIVYWLAESPRHFAGQAMNERLTFGIVGGYGATGRAAASEIWKSGAGDIVIGGRDLAKGKAFAAQFDHRVSAAQVDVLDACSMDSFCNTCSIIVNCGRPVIALQDRVAQSAFRTPCLVALVPLPTSLGAPLLRHTFRRSSLPVGGFVVVRVLGQSQGRRQSLGAEISYDKQRDYWINGLVVATVARMISEGRGVQPGLHFLADAVDPLAVMAELQRAGVGLTECFKAGGADSGN